jgi:glycosyltransferase involved in cell wall biosynthesis
MKISIVTCTWNSEPWLAQSIESVLAQDSPDIEYIFVDGGSTDGTLERIRALTRPYLLLENVRGGISRAMNEGIRVATGDVIAHLHSDDYYLSTQVLSKVAAAFNESSREWLIGRNMNDIGGILEPGVTRFVGYSPRRFAEGACFIPHPATFIKRSLFDRVGLFDERLRYAMDIDLWLRIGADGSSPLELTEYLTAFRMHSGSLSNANALASMRECYRVNLRYATHWPIAFGIFTARFGVRFLRRFFQERRIARSQAPGGQQNGSI